MTRSTEAVRPSPDIEWGKNVYDPATGDIVSREIGVLMVGIGPRLYRLEEAPEGLPFLSERVVGVDGNRTRIYLGYLGSMPIMRVQASMDKPFTLADPDRINQVIACVTQLAEIDRSYATLLRIQRIGTQYLHELRQILSGADKKALENIAVLGEAIGQYTRRDYSSEFLSMADTMDRLGLIEIEIARDLSFFRNTSSFTPAWIRNLYAPQEQTA